MNQFPYSVYTLPSGCKVYLTSRPDRYVKEGQTFTELFGETTGHKPTIRLSFTDDFIKGSLGEKHVWIPWFIDEDKRDGLNANPSPSSIATAITQIKHYESSNSTLWLHCDSSTMRAPTYFGLFLNTFYTYEERVAIQASRETNKGDNYHWSSPLELAQIDIDRDLRVRILLREIKEKL